MKRVLKIECERAFTGSDQLYFYKGEERLGYLFPYALQTDDTDLLLFVCGFHCQHGYQTEYYDREDRCCYWNPFAEFADLTPYVK